MSEFSTIVFDPQAQFTHPMLVEASAGTGKTYNIQNVYLRLVLQGLTVQQILVVTFTNAATRELRDRLRTILIQCRYHLDGATQAAGSPDAQRITAAIAASGAPAGELSKRIRVALMDFDSAAIFTIHGFCNRVLDHYAFECGHDPDAELMSEASEIVRETCRDWWRQNAYKGTVPFDSFEDLFTLASEIHKNPTATLCGGQIPDTPAFREWVAACARIWEQIGSLGGNFSWRDEKTLVRARAVVDLSPFIALAKKYNGEYSTWLSGNTKPHELSLVAKAQWETLATILRGVASNDPKNFAASVQKIGKLETKYDARLGERDLQFTKQAGVVSELTREIRARLRDRIALTYDSMLENVRAVLNNGQAGPRLREVLRAEFKAALIDEFQDTDSIQYDIFWNLFGAPESQTPLVFVGDPKQAIYGFRGGDVFTYYDAKNKIPTRERHSLGTNYRSEANLVAAINQLFADPPDGRTFLNENVPYDGKLNANDVGADKELLISGKRDNCPLKIWRIAEGRENEWARYTVSEIVRLLSDSSTTIGGERVHPGQIAVLVKAHKEALEIQDALIACGVNAVRQASGNVFDSPDAPRLALLMQAMLEPGKSRMIRSALATGLLPCSPEMLMRFKAEEEAIRAAQPVQHAQASATPDPLSSFEGWVEKFRDAGKRWEDASFMEAFRYLALELKLFPHLAKQENGKRRCIELQHLVELIHREATERRLGPIALNTWYARQTNGDERDDDGNDEHKPRITDDDDAVQIMTVFKSKGLQFPIVFVPTLSQQQSSAGGNKSAFIKYHDDQNKLILDLDKSGSPHKEKAVQEVHEENIRKVYVALTRAINRVYLFASEKGADATKYAVAHVLNALNRPDNDTSNIEQQEAPEPAGEKWKGPPMPDAATLSERKLKAPVDKSHGHASFSGLASHREAKAKEPDIRDVDQTEATLPEMEEIQPDPIFSIPGGAKLGECWHEIFELSDFRDSAASIREVTDRVLDKYRVCPRPADGMPKEKQDLLNARREAVHEMIAKTLSTPLPAASGSFKLKDIPLAHRRSELEFNFSLKDADRKLKDIADILDAHWQTPARNDDFIQRIKERETTIPRGFMIGFMDLVFQHGGKFYILDWKSNRLNGRADGFGADGIAAEMEAHMYYLQYLLYSVALHGFLAGRLENYNFDAHFGGVFYLFVRGMDGKSNRGIFHDCPPKPLIEELAAFLGGVR